MESNNYYDVAVISTSLSSLITAASLARRGFRVIVISHEDSRSHYLWDNLSLPRYPFVFYGMEYPCIQKVCEELSITQLIKRKAEPLDPSLQFIFPKHRIDFTKDEQIFFNEIQREFPEIRREAENFYLKLDEFNKQLNTIFESDHIFPPEGFFEKRGFSLSLGNDPFKRQEINLLNDFPKDHPFIKAILFQLACKIRLDINSISMRTLLRIHQGWKQSAFEFEGGIEGVKKLIEERIGTYSGVIRTDLKPEEIVLKRNKITGIKIKGSGEIIGCNFIVCGSSLSHFLSLVPQENIDKNFLKFSNNFIPTSAHYSVNFVVEDKVIPPNLGHQVIYIPYPEKDFIDNEAIYFEVIAPKNYPDIKIISASTIINYEDYDNIDYLKKTRDRIKSHLHKIIPFFPKYLIADDSPWEGGKLYDYREKKEIIIDEAGNRGPKWMELIYKPEKDMLLGIAGLQYSTGIKNLIFVGPEIIPGLDIEGSFLTGWSGARLIMKLDKRNEKLRKDFWTKLQK